VIQKNYLKFVADDHKEQIRQIYELSLKPGFTPTRVEYRRLCKNGRQLPTEIMANRNMYEGRMANLGICRDISERVELENRYREMEKLKALSLQAASIAHDVRNPLSTVRMNLQLFARTDLSPESHRLIEASLSEVDQIEKSLQEMMNIRFPLRLSSKWVDIRKLLDACLSSLHQRLTQNQVAVLLRIGRQIKKIKADPQRLEQALLNLLFNAVEAQPSGGKLTLIVRPLERKSKPWIEILVADHGPGVPKEMLPYLFDPTFSQKAMGTGLGLHNVKEIIEAHGGSVLSKLNRRGGMSFYLHLPLEEK
jgi:signal transduction histidine kinase